MSIEVEGRGFISKEKYDELLDFFKKEGEFINEDYQETHYFDTKEDLRIQKNNFFSKICLKKGQLHDDFREEVDIKFNKEDFEKLENLFAMLGFGVEVKWFRKRHSFKWQGLNVTIDDTKGFGYIIEIEKLSNEAEKEAALKLIKQKFQELRVPVASKEELKEKFKYYRDNWKQLINL